MERKTWTTMDKTSWGDGPWVNEVDKEQWPDEATGLPCLIRRNPHGALCGYVGVSEGHPWFERAWEDVAAAGGLEVGVHDGLSYFSFCQEGDDAHTICHVPAPGEPDRVWWLGFSCGSTWDIRPEMEARERAQGYPPIRIGGETYKTIAYVKAECASLAAQAQAAVATKTAIGGIDAMTAAPESAP